MGKTGFGCFQAWTLDMLYISMWNRVIFIACSMGYSYWTCRNVPSMEFGTFNFVYITCITFNCSKVCNFI